MAALNAFLEFFSSALAGYGAEGGYDAIDGTTDSVMGHSLVTRMLHGDSEGNTLGRDATAAFWVVALAFFCMCYMAWGIGSLSRRINKSNYRCLRSIDIVQATKNIDSNGVFYWKK